jgi:hypothetical protein
MLTQQSDTLRVLTDDLTPTKVTHYTNQTGDDTRLFLIIEPFVRYIVYYSLCMIDLSLVPWF